ncbi:MAG: hypothetical protein JWM85_796 [Acidimicrobiaceae bacterium]|nr:hypothetical protein [Acidimicrobiaceae bacterium]
MLQTFAGGDLVAERYGAGPPRVLALHGWARSRSDFAALLADSGHAALAIDLPGFGDSPPPPETWGSAQYARALEPVLTTCAERVLVVGHSFGGRVALHLATQHPDRLAGLVLTGVPLYKPQGRAPRPALSYRVIRALSRAGLLSSERLEAARRRHGSADYRAAVGVVRDVLVRVLAEHYDAEIAEISCPVELVWGDEDNVVPLEVPERAVTAFANAHLDVVTGVDHFLPLRAPGALESALERLGAGAS